MSGHTGGNNSNGVKGKGDMSALFRQKVAFMKSWQPASLPSNRDKLELFALQKQATSGNAPEASKTQMSPADRAKYNAWRSKSGMSSEQAMREYISEAERQLLVYGTQGGGGGALQAGDAQPSRAVGDVAAAANQQQSSTATAPQQQSLRGLAAIPLLCAAASESRKAYLRRLANTPYGQAWWRRQEPLTATPGSIYAFPEQILLVVATIVEHFSLQPDGLLIIPAPVVQSFLWPLHNVLLAQWIQLILINTALTAVAQLIQTILLGSRSTGVTLSSIMTDQVQFAAQSVRTLTENHQPLTARLVGLALWPFAYAVNVAVMLGGGSPEEKPLVPALLFIFMALWSGVYTFIFLPGFAWFLTWMALVSGGCFALIEMSGV